MDSPLLLIWVLVCLLQYTSSSEVIRQKNYDIILPRACEKVDKCHQKQATCTLKDASKQCCKKCQCANRTTYYKRGLIQACLLNPNNEAGCEYQLDSKDLHWVKLQKEDEAMLGKLAHQKIKIYAWTCKIIKRQYWDLLTWKDLTMGGKNNVYINEVKNKHEVKLRIPQKNTSLYEGLLVKLQINCNKKYSNTAASSCVIFKIDGKRKYSADTEAEVVTPKPPTKTGPKEKKKTKITIIIIIGATAVVLLIVVVVIVLCCRRRKAKYGNGSLKDASKTGLLRRGEDPQYHNPSDMPGRHSSEVGSSANNLTYLQPVDAGWQNNGRPTTGKHKNKKNDPNYDYPDIENMSRKSDYQLPQDINNQKPIYAEVAELKRDPPYIKPRSVTGVVGVPGYQPPTGILPPRDGTCYSSLGVGSSGDTSNYQSLLDTEKSEASKENVDWEKNDESGPPSPKYAEVVPEEDVEVKV